MALTVKDNTKIGVEIEVTEGTYLAPQSASSYVQTLSDGTEMTPAKELLEREIFNGSIGKTTPRTGTRSVSGAVPTEARASSTEGSAPEYDALLRSALGLRRQKTADTTSKAAGHTASRLEIEDADIADFEVGDIVLVKEAGDYHVSPIIAKDSGAGVANIDLLVPAAGAFSGSVVIAKYSTYTTADSGHPTLSISKYVEDAVLEQATGSRVNAMELQSFETGQVASWNFGFEGLSFDRSLTAIPHTPAFDSSLPPIILNACLFQDGVQLDVNALSFSLENTLGFATSTCSPNGRFSSRVTARSITGSINPYKQDNSIAQFTKFNTNTEFSLFAYAYNPTAVAGEYEQIVAVYLPNCIITEMGESDQDGLLVNDLSFSASRGTDASEEEIYLGFI